MSKTASKIGANPLDFIGQGVPGVRAVPDVPGGDGGQGGRRIVLKTYRLPADLVERVADVAWSERCPTSGLVAQAVRELVARLEEKRGAPYPKRPADPSPVPSTL